MKPSLRAMSFGVGPLLMASTLVGGIGLLDVAPVQALPTLLYVSSAGSGMTCSSSSPCSISEALSIATTGDTVELFSGEYSGNFAVPSVTVEPVPGQTAPVELNGGGVVGLSVIAVGTGVNATIQNLTITNGDGAWGGAIYNDGSLVISHSTITDSRASGGAGGRPPMEVGLYGRTLTLESSTVSNNTAPGDDGGGLFIDAGGSAVVSTSTFAGNSAGYAGGAIYNYNGTLTIDSATFANNIAQISAAAINNTGTEYLENDLIGNNTSPPVISECANSGPIYDYDYNFSDDGTCGFGNFQGNAPASIDKFVGTLGQYGGMTPTVPLLPAARDGSQTVDPALAVVTGSPCSTPDQRGVVRTSPCDIGAFELISTSTSLAPPNLSSEVTIGGTLTFTATVSPPPDGGNVVFFVDSVPVTCLNDGTEDQAIDTSTGVDPVPLS